MNSYKLLDSGNFMKLEQVGPFRIVRPSACAVWDQTLPTSEWKRFDAEFKRYADGNGEWLVKNEKIKQSWAVAFSEITFNLKLTGFGHLGIFAEQEKSWRTISNLIKERQREGQPFRVLNLFAYTGGSTLFAASAGAEVVHLDASKSSVAWARDNAEASGLTEKSIRWLVDDVQEFVEKEVRREKKYEGLILDPPSYGRGHKNQIWNIEEHLMPLLKNMAQLFSPDFCFMLLSSHSPGYTPKSLENQLKQVAQVPLKNKSLRFDSDEMLIVDSAGKSLPSGAYSLLICEESADKKIK